MNNQSKILSSLAIAILVGAAFAALFSLAGDDELLENLQSSGAGTQPGVADDWSDVNDSLGG
jgi:hypothetical protein